MQRVFLFGAMVLVWVVGFIAAPIFTNLALAGGNQHVHEAIEHAEEAVDHGQQGHPDAIVTHA